MIELWGSADCEACNIAREFLGRTPLEWKYIDVATIKFEGVIPRLILEDGQHIIDLPAIKNYVQRWMKEQGFPGGIL